MKKLVILSLLLFFCFFGSEKSCSEVDKSFDSTFGIKYENPELFLVSDPRSTLSSFYKSKIEEDLGTLELNMESVITIYNWLNNYFNALNVSFDYPAGNGTIGAGYERIDPNYKTLGAYFFNNDLENITVNASQTIFDNKLNLSVNAGLQQDNLDNEL